MRQSLQFDELVRRNCARDDLSTYDPYDIWKTNWGFRIKHFYNCHPHLGLLPAAALTVFDTFLNNGARIFYTPQEYPIVRALAAQCLLNLCRNCPQDEYFTYAMRHLDWLKAHACTGNHGLGWGLRFRYAVAKDLIYDDNTPFSTMTPYVLEAFVQYSDLTGDRRYEQEIHGIYRFFAEDIQVMEDTKDTMATSYVPRKDRIVINASSYAMWCFTLLLKFLGKEERAETERRVVKLYRFVQRQQRSDGSWLYAPTPSSFIDCFHSCIVLKNLYKTQRVVHLEGCETVISRGYEYVKNAFLDTKTGLYRRFSVANKPGLVTFDLYDNAEMLNLSTLLGDVEEAKRLQPIIKNTFCIDDDIYSQIVLGGLRRNKNTLRWAVMPYLYALTTINRVGSIQ